MQELVKPPEDVGVSGVFPVGDDGESGSLEPDESFVRFFLRRLKVGMRRPAAPMNIDSSSDWSRPGNCRSDASPFPLFPRISRVQK